MKVTGSGCAGKHSASSHDVKKGLKMHSVYPALELTLSGARVVGPSEVLTVSSEGTVRGASQCETGELDT